MKPARFTYAEPATVDEAAALLAERGDAARVIAGGQSLAPLLNMRLAAPEILIDIARLAPLKQIEIKDHSIEVGAAVTQHELHSWPALATAQPLLSLTLPFIGHYQTRQRGTVCGSLAHADPSAELPLALAMLKGEVVARRGRAERRIVAAAFQTGLLSTALEPDEMIIAARFPLATPGSRVAFREVSQRHGDFAIVALAAIGSAAGVRLGIGGVADRPIARDLPWLSGAALDDALNDFAWELGGRDDPHASARYRRELVRRLGRAMFEELRDAAA
jgi:2-furoyl-CoA dehydrogenase FAD binding subunit